MKRIFLMIVMLCSAAAAQTTTIYTGTVKDLSGATVTTGKITFDLQPSIDVTISSNARFTPRTVTCLISNTGNPVAQSDGVSACQVTNNTALMPSGTSYKINICPYNACTSSFIDYAIGGTKDISTVVPTPLSLPAYTFMDLASTQAITGSKTFTGVVAIDGEVYSTTFTTLQAAIAATPEGGTLHVSASTTFSSTLSITKNFTMLCSPNTVQTFSGTGDIVLIDGTGLTNNFLSRLVIRGCTFSGNAAATNGIHIKNASRMALYDVTTRNVSARCIYLDSAVSPLLIHTKCSSNEVAFTTVPVNGIYLDNSTSNVTDIDPIIEGVSGCGIVSANASRAIHLGGTLEGNGCSIDDQALSSYNVYDAMDLESNSGTDDVMLKGSHTTFRAIADTTGSSTSVHVYAGALHNKIDGGYVGKVTIDGPNTYTDIRSTWITTTFTNNDGTTNIKDAAFFNGSSWRRLPETIANFSGLPNNTSTVPFSRICEATDCLRQLNIGWSTTTTFGPNGFAFLESVRAGTAATPLALNLGFGARVIIPELSFAVDSNTADDNFFTRTGPGAMSFGSTHGGTNGVLTLGSIVASGLGSFGSGKFGAAGSTISQDLTCTGAITPASVNATTCAEQTFTIAACSGLATTDTIYVNQSTASLTLAMPIGDWRVSSAGVIARTYCNPTAGALTPTAQTLKIWARH